MEASSSFLNPIPSSLSFLKPLESAGASSFSILRLRPPIISVRKLCTLKPPQCSGDFPAVPTLDSVLEVEDDDGVPDEGSCSIENWEAVFLGELNQTGSLRTAERKKLPESRLLPQTDQMDWCVRARKVALKSIEAKELTEKMKSMVTREKKRKKRKKKQPNFDKLSISEDEDDLDFGADESEPEFDTSDSTAPLRRTVSMIANGMFEERKEKSMEAFVQRLSQFSGPSDRRKEVMLNKSIVDAQTAEEVLEVTADMIVAVAKGLSPSPLSPLNIATALHRIAKNMEKVSMMSTHRLAFARKREMSMLVGMAMVALPDCSAQGVSNIAWALSKIGGELLYLSEMERVAEVALTKVAEFNAQNIANLAGAFASMRHAAPLLFSELSLRASNIINTFQPQEITQVLWAFASLYQPADSLLESLDKMLENEKLQIVVQESSILQNESVARNNTDSSTFTFMRNQMSNICWSYAVLGQLDRVFFSHVWRKLCQCDEHISDQYKGDVVFASQLHHVNLCLKLEYPHLQLLVPRELEDNAAAARKTRKFNQKVTSSFQKEVLRLLVCTGLDWVKEYNVEGYTMDAVLIDRKVALEIDGPTHFSRNSGAPLGHTVLKRRCITAAGWKLISLSHQEWEELSGESQQQDYLRGLLSGVNCK